MAIRRRSTRFSFVDEEESYYGDEIVVAVPRRAIGESTAQLPEAQGSLGGAEEAEEGDGVEEDETVAEKGQRLWRQSMSARRRFVIPDTQQTEEKEESQSPENILVPRSPDVAVETAARRARRTIPNSSIGPEPVGSEEEEKEEEVESSEERGKQKGKERAVEGDERSGEGEEDVEEPILLDDEDTAFSQQLRQRVLSPEDIQVAVSGGNKYARAMRLAYHGLLQVVFD